MSPPSTLILVCGHAIYNSSTNPKSDPYDEQNWLIASFQRGETPTFIAHIEAGLNLLAEDENALLVFSGGATKPAVTRRSEAQGYRDVAKLLWEGRGKDQVGDGEEGKRSVEEGEHGRKVEWAELEQRIFEDSYATDSYQNVLLSLIQFPLFARRYQQSLFQTAQRTESRPETRTNADNDNLEDYDELTWPKKLIIISHDFKRERFLLLHLPALRWANIEDMDFTEFVGINPPFDGHRMLEIAEGDRVRGTGAWARDVYGAGELLTQKRKERGWDTEKFVEDVLGQYGRVFGEEGRRVRDVLEGLVRFEGVVRVQDLDREGKRFVGRLPWE